MDELIWKRDALDALKKAYWNANLQSAKDDHCVIDAMTDWAIRQIKALPTVRQDLYLEEKMDKAYDDGYEAGYLQARHDWGNLDE